MFRVKALQAIGAAKLRVVVTSGGTLALHSTALDGQIRSLQDQIDAGQREVDAFEANLREQFTALESFVSGLKSQGSFLTQAFGR